MSVRPDVSSRRRRGCLTGCLIPLLGLLVFGLAVAMALDFAIARYTFYYGGHFHVIPGWQGEGWIHAPEAGGDYHVALYIEPTTPGYRKSDIKATVYLCTPKGERFTLRAGGDWPRSRPTNTLGVPVHLYLYNWSTFSFSSDRRPSLDFYGAFGDRRLELEDRGSLEVAFRSDGTLYPPHDQTPRRKRTIRFTLTESDAWILSRSCPPRP